MPHPWRRQIRAKVAGNWTCCGGARLASWHPPVCQAPRLALAELTAATDLPSTRPAWSDRCDVHLPGTSVVVVQTKQERPPELRSPDKNRPFADRFSEWRQMDSLVFSLALQPTDTGRCLRTRFVQSRRCGNVTVWRCAKDLINHSRKWIKTVKIEYIGSRNPPVRFVVIDRSNASPRNGAAARARCRCHR